MSTDHQFASFVTSLRAPRLALCIDDEHFITQASSALRVHSQLWGGVGNTVVTAVNGELHPAVARALSAYDPDHVSVLGLTAMDLESQSPGKAPFELDGELVTDPQRRAELFAEMDAHGPQILMDAVDEADMAALRLGLNVFEDHGESRVPSIHPAQIDEAVMSTIGVPDPYPIIETGDAFLDLAVGLRRGISAQPSKALDLSPAATIRSSLDLLLGDAATDDQSPWGATVMGLTRISSGGHRANVPIVVFGRAGSDMSLATTLERHRGNVAWLPIATEHSAWLTRLGDGLLSMGRRYKRQVIITSTSLSDTECLELLEHIRAASLVKWPTARPIEVTYTPPDEVPLELSPR